MFDFRLRVFHEVAQKLSFTQAAQVLYISQPAVTRHIRELEGHWGLRLFNRKGNRITLTQAGNIAFKHVSQMLQLHADMEFELNNIKKKYSGSLHIGASSTISQYLIPPVLGAFHERFKDITISLTNGNSRQIEQKLLDGEIDLGLVESHSQNRQLQYRPFLSDRLVGIVNTKGKLANKTTISLSEFKTTPLILREPGSGTLEVIEHCLKQNDIKISQLDVLLHLGSTESIKHFLETSDGMGIVSEKAIEKELLLSRLKIVNLENIPFPRQFRFVYPSGPLSGLCELFVNFALRHYNIRL